MCPKGYRRYPLELLVDERLGGRGQPGGRKDGHLLLEEPARLQASQGREPVDDRIIDAGDGGLHRRLPRVLGRLALDGVDEPTGRPVQALRIRRLLVEPAP
jgi:hypothetical protein